MTRNSQGRFSRVAREPEAPAPSAQQQQRRLHSRPALSDVTNTLLESERNKRIRNQAEEIKELKGEIAELRREKQEKDDRERISRESKRKADWKARKALQDQDSLGVNNKSRQIAKRNRRTALKPDADDRVRKDFTYHHAKILESHFDKFTDEGVDGYSAATVVAGLFRRHPSLKRDVFDQLRTGETIQQQTLSAIQKHWDAEWMNGAASALGLKARGVRLMKKMLMHTWCRTKQDYVPIELPYPLGDHGRVCEPPGEDALRAQREKTADEYGLEEAADGSEVHVDLKVPLQKKLSLLPRDVLFKQLRNGRCLRAQCLGDASRWWKRRHFTSPKGTIVALKPMVEWRIDTSGKLLPGWGMNGRTNNLKVCGYQGGDTYDEFCSHAGCIQQQLDDLEKDGITLDDGTHLDVQIVGGGDSAFLNAIRGKCGATAKQPCEQCDIMHNELHLSKNDFKELGMPLPMQYDYLTNLKLTHSLGDQYVYTDETGQRCVLNEPYRCPACGELIEKDGDHPPLPGRTASQTTKNRQRWQQLHKSHRHGCPDGFKGRDIVSCMLHANLDIWPQIWRGTICQNVQSDELVAAVMEIVHDEWHLHRVTEDMVRRSEKKTMPHFNGPELTTVIECREELLGFVLPGDEGTRLGLSGRDLWADMDDVYDKMYAVPTTQQEREAAAVALETAAEKFVHDFVKYTGFHEEATMYMHSIMHHFGDSIRKYGCLAAWSGEGLEASNYEWKNENLNGTNRRPPHLRKNGVMSHGRLWQVMNKIGVQGVVNQGLLRDQKLPKAVRRSLSASANETPI